MIENRLGRRGLLAGAAAAGLLPGAARADEQVVVATWGGDYANLLRGNVEEPLLMPKGITVVQDLGDEDPRVGQVICAAAVAAGGG